jgi:hypothetical protein
MIDIIKTRTRPMDMAPVSSPLKKFRHKKNNITLPKNINKVIETNFMKIPPFMVDLIINCRGSIWRKNC